MASSFRSIRSAASRVAAQRGRLSMIDSSVLRSTIHHYYFSSDNSSKVGLSSLDALQNLAEKLNDRKFRSQDDGVKKEATESKLASNTETKRRQRELATQICHEYSNLPPLQLPLSPECPRGGILLFMALDCSPQDDDILKASEAFIRSSEAIITEQNPPPIVVGSSLQAVTHLRKATTPHYENIIQFLLRVNALDGISFMMALREDLMQASKWLHSQTVHDKRSVQFKELDNFIRKTFKLWFNPGMLDTRRITYEETSASIIEAIATKEAVHPMKSLEDLRNRLSSGNKRVFAIFHKLMPTQPLVFVHASLESKVPAGMDQVMEVPNSIDDHPKVAAFYSISNGHRGLAGVGLGEFLLKEATKLLSEEFTSIDAFVTLSPLPEFRKWVETKVKQSVRSNPFNDENVVDEDSVNALVQASLLTKEDSTDNHKVLVRLLELVSSQKSQKEHHNTLSPILSKLMARYLVVEKHRKRPLDPVTRFHVGNGAEVWRVNFDADPSRKGMRSSFGCMVNYRYDLDAIEENQRNFELSHTVPVHEQVSKWISSKVKL